MSKLTAKQAAFCREYIVDCNGTQAAIRAGFFRTHSARASQMLALPHIDAEVRRLQEELAAANNVFSSLLRRTLRPDNDEART